MSDGNAAVRLAAKLIEPNSGVVEPADGVFARSMIVVGLMLLRL
jgi:hypothetical protein